MVVSCFCDTKPDIERCWFAEPCSCCLAGKWSINKESFLFGDLVNFQRFLLLSTSKSLMIFKNTSGKILDTSIPEILEKIQNKFKITALHGALDSPLCVMSYPVLDQ